jgi:hypothetical protein
MNQNVFYFFVLRFSLFPIFTKLNLVNNLQITIDNNSGFLSQKFKNKDSLRGKLKFLKNKNIFKNV